MRLDYAGYILLVFWACFVIFKMATLPDIAEFALGVFSGVWLSASVASIILDRAARIKAQN